jgi:F-type H+-transporting ATPase subunit delta
VKTNKQSRRDAKQLFQSCKVNGVLDENRVRQTVNLIAEKKPRGYYTILTHYVRLVRLEVSRRSALVESASPISTALQQGVTANLTRIYGEGLRLAFAQNPALIGGLRVKVGSDVYDGSIRARLAQLEENV